MADAVTERRRTDVTPEHVREWAGRALSAGVVAAGIAVVAVGVRAALQFVPPDVAWLVVQAPLAVGVFVLAWRFAARHERQWVRPARRVCELIDEIRAGDAPIDELTSLAGPIAPLAGRVGNALRDLRQQRQELAALQQEIRQRVMHRTDALERTIGSLRTQASRDALTGLYNRRMLDAHLPKVIEQCREEGVPLCLLSIDLDHFKLLNDTLGHAAGDDLLRSIGQLIRSACREQDLAFRNGGDEFIVLLPGCDHAVGKSLAGRLASLVDQLAKPLRTPKKPGLSVGTVCFTDLAALTPEGVLEQGDAAMYEKKAARKAGR